MKHKSLYEPHLSKREFLALCGKSLGALWAAQTFGFPETTLAQMAKKGLIKTKLSPYFTPLTGGEIRCELCPKRCHVARGKRGYCRVRENRDGELYSLVYGNPCALHLDPIEKKPFLHVLPGTNSLSIATAGCYVEPTIFYEYMVEIAGLTKKAGLLNVMHTNGFINEDPLRTLCEVLDAAQVDLKGFTETFYSELCAGELTPVLETLKIMKQEKVHLEITNLVIPTKNDEMSEVREMCLWVKGELGADTPIHFNRFYPLHKLKRLPSTPVSTLEKAREVALSTGLEYVYIGNVPGHQAWNTFCPKCKNMVIQRSGYMIGEVHLKEEKCGYCGKAIPGIWKTV
jgi:pyruvate formate lyase activating enzyme